MSLLVLLTLKVSAILLPALIGTVLLYRSSAATRHWVLAVGVVSAVAAPALHVLPTPPVARIVPVGPLSFDTLRSSAFPTVASPRPPASARPPGPYVQFTEPEAADAVGSVIAPPAGPRPGRSRSTEPEATDAVGSVVAPPPAGSRPGRSRPMEPEAVDAVGPVVAPSPAGSRPGRSPQAAPAVAVGDIVGRLAVVVWLVGAFAGLGVLLVGLARLRWLRASSSRVTDGRWHRLCADLSRSYGLTRGVDLLLGPRPGLVATWGWRRPVVMVPASASGWSAERMRVVLLHELAHVRRGDWLLQLAAEALRCVWWFNPLAWLVRARLRRESEHAADDLVLARGVPAATCATHLLELAREARKYRWTWLPAPAMARPSNLERRVSTMLNPRTNRRPLTRFARFGSLGVLAPASIVVAVLQVGPVSASRSAESTGATVEREQPAGPPGGRPTEFTPVTPTLRDRVQVGSVSAPRSAESVSVPRSAESTGTAVEREQPAEPPSSESLSEFVPVAAARADRDRVQVGPVSVSRSAESTAARVEEEQPAASPGGLTDFVPAPAASAVLPGRTRVGSAPVSRFAESIGDPVEREQPAEPSSGQTAEPVAGATGFQGRLQTLQSVLDEPPAPPGGPDRPTGRSTEPIRVGDDVRPPAEARTGTRGAAVEEATVGPTGGVDDIEVVRGPVPGLGAADEGRSGQGAHTSEADAGDSSAYKVLATRRASTLERELNEAAAAGYRLQTLTWHTGGSLWGTIPLPGDRREMMAIVARGAQPGRFSYRVVAARDETELEIEGRLNEAGRAGFRVREVGPSVILERDAAADPVATEFRVVTTTRISTLEAEIAAAGRDGYRPVGLAPPAAVEGLVAILSRPRPVVTVTVRSASPPRPR